MIFRLFVIGWFSFWSAVAFAQNEHPFNPSGDIQKTGYSASTVTTETLAIEINPTTGADPNSSVGIWSSQAQYDAWGKFASVKGVVTVLPKTLVHDVTLTIDDGAYAVGSDFFDGMGALSVAQAGVQLTIASVSKLSQVGGTVTSTIAGSAGGYSLTFTADPGYAANAYRGYWLVITSGTGAGQYKAIRSHNGINYEVAGRFSPIDGTSQVQIQDETVTLNLAGVPTIGLPNWQYIYLTSVATKMSGLQFASTSYAEFVGGSIEFDACEIGSGGFGAWFYQVMSVETNNLIINGGGYGVVMFAGGFLRCGDAESSTLLRGMSSYGVYGAGRYASIYLCKTALDDNASGVYIEEGNLNLYNPVGTGNAIGVELGQDTSLQIDISSQITRGVSGSTDVSVMGDYYTYTEINSERSATVQPDGNLDDYIKVLRVESNTATGAGTITYTLAGTTMAYTAPGDAIGAAVNIGVGGEFVLHSNNGNWIHIWVNPTTPAGNTSDTFTVGTARIENQGSIVSVY